MNDQKHAYISCWQQYSVALSSKKYQLEKSLWTDTDFENMGWHDCPIYATAFGDNYQLLFDIDYIFKWVQTGKKFKFWIAPCTLVFENVYNINFDLDLSNVGIEINEIYRDNPQQPKNADYIKTEIEFDWTIETHQGNISFKSVGFKQHVRQLPQFLYTQKIGLEERGGISFDRLTIEQDILLPTSASKNKG